MANTFTKAVSSASVGTTLTDIYTVDSGKTAIVVGINLANVVDSQIKVTVILTTGSSNVHLVKNVPVPAGSTLAVLDGKLVAEAGDIIKVESDTAASTDVIISILEQD